MVKEEIKSKITKVSWGKQKWEYIIPELGEFSKTSSKREKFILINAYLKKQERSKMKNLNLCFKELEKEE